MGTVGIHDEDRLARCRTNFFDKKDWAGLEAWSIRHPRGAWSMIFRVPPSTSGATRFIQQWAVVLESAKLIFQKLRIRQTKKQAECGHRNQRYSQESSKNRWQTFKPCDEAVCWRGCLDMTVLILWQGLRRYVTDSAKNDLTDFWTSSVLTHRETKIVHCKLGSRVYS